MNTGNLTVNGGISGGRNTDMKKRSRSNKSEIAHRCNSNPCPSSESSYAKTDAINGKSVHELLFESVNAYDVRDVDDFVSEPFRPRS